MQPVELRKTILAIMRNEALTMAHDGQSLDEIRDYLDRDYGDTMIAYDINIEDVIGKDTEVYHVY